MTLFFGLSAFLFAIQGQWILSGLFLGTFLWLWASETGQPERGPCHSSGYPSVMPPYMAFGPAFALARERGLREFEWRGGWYHTRTAEEEAALKPRP